MKEYGNIVLFPERLNVKGLSTQQMLRDIDAQQLQQDSL